jgi:light-regulated signal transduction histidine kinase (bacteriophytochrome)
MTATGASTSPHAAVGVTAQHLAQCAAEPIHIPGTIQPHGAMLLADADGRIVAASRNCAQIIGIDAAAALGRPLAEVAPIDALPEALTAGESAIGPRPMFVGAASLHGRTCNALAHRVADRIVLELEPAAPAERVTFQNLFRIVRGSAATLDGAATLEGACAAAAREVRRLTGFDRVMIYRFDPNWNGQVVAEDKAGDPALASYMGLWFPASDIPAQARELYTRNPIRLIPDAAYHPVELLAAPGQQPLDMSQAALRSVSPVHLEYLRNMHVGASMSISILSQGKLWGLIACHHRSPRFIGYEIRTACELLGQILALEVGGKEEGAAAAERIVRNAMHAQLLAAMAAEEDFLTGLTKASGDLLKFADASGAALLFGRRCILLGSTPPEDAVRSLVRHLAQAEAGDVFATDHLAALLPDAAAYTPLAAGCLAIAVSRMHASSIVWFRPEVIQTVNWSGDPHRSAEARAAAAGEPERLHPRKSFELWKQTVRGRSLPWSPAIVESAADFRSAVVSIVLRTAEEMAGLAEELQRSNRELEAFSYSVSHDLRAPFRHIQGFSELLRQRLAETAGDQVDPTVKTYLETIARSAEYAGSLVDALLSLAQLGRAEVRRMPLDMKAMAEETIRSLGQEIGSRHIDWRLHDLPPAVADPTMMRVLWRNLLANAVKYTAKTKDPRIEIGALRDADGERYYVTDNGVGFDMRYVHKLFGVFQRLHRMEDFEGTGIGLANVRRIVERHGGRVAAQGAPNLGATFTFSIPPPRPDAHTRRLPDG